MWRQSSGCCCLFAWAQNTQIHAVAWWGFAHLIRAASIVLFGMYGSAPDLITIDLANALLFTAFAVTWTGARVFDGRAGEPVYLVTGAVIWLLVCRLPVLTDALETRAMIASSIVTAYTWLTAYEFWPVAASSWSRAGRRSLCFSPWRTVHAAHAAGDAAALSPTNMYGSVWLTVLSFEALLFTISVAFILLAMARSGPSCATAPPR